MSHDRKPQLLDLPEEVLLHILKFVFPGFYDGSHLELSLKEWNSYLSEYNHSRLDCRDEEIPVEEITRHDNTAAQLIRCFYHLQRSREIRGTPDFINIGQTCQLLRNLLQRLDSLQASRLDDYGHPFVPDRDEDGRCRGPSKLLNPSTTVLKVAVDLVDDLSVRKWRRDHGDAVPAVIEALDTSTLHWVLIIAYSFYHVSLRDVSAAGVASLIRGKSPEEIRRQFNIRCDFSREEREQLEEENAWCEEIGN